MKIETWPIDFQGWGLTPSMRVALSDLRLQRLTVLYPGDLRYDLGHRVTVVPAAELVTDPEAIMGGPGGGGA